MNGPLICARLEDAPRVPNSATGRCTRCRAAVTVAPSSWPWLKAGSPLECAPCAVDELRAVAPL